MKFRKGVAFQLLFCLSVILLGVEAQVKKSRDNDYSYSYDYGDYNAGGSKENVAKPPVDRRIPCYACTYHQVDGQPQGTINCNEPFVSLNVPEVMCNGSCAMTNIWTNKPTDFIIIRDCRPVCRETVSEIQYTRCCSSKLCNSFTSSVQQDGFSRCLTVLLAVVASVGFELFA